MRSKKIIDNNSSALCVSFYIECLHKIHDDIILTAWVRDKIQVVMTLNWNYEKSMDSGSNKRFHTDVHIYSMIVTCQNDFLWIHEFHKCYITWRQWTDSFRNCYGFTVFHIWNRSIPVYSVSFLLLIKDNIINHTAWMVHLQTGIVFSNASWYTGLSLLC